MLISNFYFYNQLYIIRHYNHCVDIKKFSFLIKIVALLNFKLQFLDYVEVFQKERHHVNVCFVAL